MLGQHPQAWQSAPGKEEIGTLPDRMRNFFPALAKGNSPLFLAAFAAGIALSLRRLLGKKGSPADVFVMLAIAFFVSWLFVIGPTRRFVTLLTPFFALAAIPLLSALYERFSKRFAVSGMAVLAAVELLYSINTQLLPYPVGAKYLAYADTRFETYAWGYAALDDALAKRIEGKFPSLRLETTYAFLERLADAGIEQAKQTGAVPSPTLFVYDENLLPGPRLWIMDRRQVYRGWPFMNAATYNTILEEKGADYFSRAGLTEQFFIAPTVNVPLRPKDRQTSFGLELERQLINRGKTPIEVITNPRGEPVFRIYKM